MRFCPGCVASKDIRAFYHRSGKPDRFCRECVKNRRRATRKTTDPRLVERRDRKQFEREQARLAAMRDADARATSDAWAQLRATTEMALA